MRFVWLLKTRLRLSGFRVWPSYSGFGVTTCWPAKGYLQDIYKIADLVVKHLPVTWISTGPTSAAGGSLVIYCWPENDPDIEDFLEYLQEST